MRNVWRFLVLLASCASCAAHEPQWFFGDENYLRVGVDPRDEANALVQTYAEQSERPALRIVGRDFTALGFTDRSGRATRARIVTGRGIVVALDPEPATPLTAAVQYALIAGPLPDTQDADGDGFEEVFIEARSPTGTCLLVYRVRDVGFVDPVPAQFSWLGREHCPTSVADLDNDGRAELLLDVELVDFELPAPPALRIVLWADRHRFVLRDDMDRFTRYVAQEEAERQRELATVGGKQRVATSLRVAVELAALAKLREQPVSEQLARFDAALQGLHLKRPQREWVDAARARIEHTWNHEAPPTPP